MVEVVHSYEHVAFKWTQNFQMDEGGRKVVDGMIHGIWYYQISERGGKVVHGMIEIVGVDFKESEGRGEVVHWLVELAFDFEMEERGREVVHWLVACNAEVRKRRWEVVQRVIKVACSCKGEGSERGRERVNRPVETRP